MNVPKLRFTGFYGDWEKISLKKISNEISYGMNSPSKEYDGKNAYIRITDIDENTGRFNKNNIVSPDGNLENKYLVNDNDILFARTGASTGKTYLYSKEDGKLYYAGFLIKASIKNDYDSNFIYQQTKTRKYKKWVKIISMRSGQPGINSEEYGSYFFSITTKKEQEKISNLLKLIDKKIELQSQKIEFLKLYKICIKNIIFNDEKYTETKLKYILKKWTEKNKNNEYDYVESVSNKHGFISQNEQFEDRNVASKDKSNYYVIRKNVFAYNPSRLDVGSLALKDNDLVSLVSPLYECFTTNQNVYFMLEWFDSNEFKKGTFSKFEGGVRNTLSFTNLCEINISLPSITEQDKIANILMTFNNKLIYENLKLEKLKNLKKGLMQNMFV